LDSFTVTPEDDGARLQDFLAARYPTVSVGALRKLMSQGNVLINGVQGTRNMTLHAGDTIDVDADASDLPAALPRKMDFDVLYEDEWCVVINKPAGLAVVPEREAEEYPLMEGMLYYLQHASPFATGEMVRPMIVHRLDKDTTGALLIAKSITALRDFSEQFARRTVQKEYLAIVRGRPPREAELSFPLTAKGARAGRILVNHHYGRPAVTRITTEEYFDGYALVRAMPLTGRTHQVRVHLMASGYPLAVDPLYSGRPSRTTLLLPELKRGYRPKRDQEERPLIARQALHAHRLTFNTRSVDTINRVRVEAPLPHDMQVVLKMLRKYRPQRESE